jgi:urease accessory protein
MPSAALSTANVAAGRVTANVPGTGRLRFELVNGKTAVVESFAASPLKLIHPRHYGRAAWAVSSTYGGGLLGGDRIDLKLRLGAGTNAVLTTQASTKVYRSELAAEQMTECEIGPDAFFLGATDRIVCYAGSSLRQRQRYDLALGASLAVVDWLAAGRHETGETWQFDAYGNRLEVYAEGRMIFRDALNLTQNAGPLAERMGRFTSLATVLLMGPRVEAGAQALLARVQNEVAARTAATNFLAATSPLAAGGAVLRCAATDVETMAANLRVLLGFVADLIGEDPWARRW